MDLNADFSKRAAVHAASLAWVQSPIAGVDRRMLDRVGDEVARATSIVRYAPGSQFKPHTHGGGEEFYVLEGVFQDEHGDFPAGFYIRNPPATRHTPGSAPGCVILVKLWQFDPADQTQIRLDGNALPFVATVSGVEVKPLFRDAWEDVKIERWAPGVAIARRDIAGGAELLVLDGSFLDSGEVFARQSWLRLPAGASLDATAGAAGATVWVKTGHLGRPAAALELA